MFRAFCYFTMNIKQLGVIRIVSCQNNRQFEEQAMAAKFGDAYIDYTRQVRRWL